MRHIESVTIYFVYHITIICVLYLHELKMDILVILFYHRIQSAILLPEENNGSIMYTHVSPVVAPTQQRRVPVHTISIGRRCVWFLFYTKQAHKCNGTIKTRC